MTPVWMSWRYPNVARWYLFCSLIKPGGNWPAVAAGAELLATANASFNKYAGLWQSSPSLTAGWLQDGVRQFTSVTSLQMYAQLTTLHQLVTKALMATKTTVLLSRWRRVQKAQPGMPCALLPAILAAGLSSAGLVCATIDWLRRASMNRLEGGGQFRLLSSILPRITCLLPWRDGVTAGSAGPELR